MDRSAWTTQTVNGKRDVPCPLTQTWDAAIAVRDCPHPSVGMCIVGRWESDGEGCLCWLGVDALGDNAALGGVSRAGQPATVSGAGFVPSKPNH